MGLLGKDPLMAKHATPDMSRAENVKLLDQMLGFRIVGQVNIHARNVGNELHGARTELLSKDENGDWRIRAVQPASGRELLMYNLLQDAWDSDSKIAAEAAEKVHGNGLAGMGSALEGDSKGV